MVKQVQRRFIWIAMLSFSLVVFLIVGLSNIFSYQSITRETEESLSLIADNLELAQQYRRNPRRSKFRNQINYQEVWDDAEELFGDIRYFIVAFDKQGEVKEFNVTRTFDVNEEEAIRIATKCYKNKEDKGNEGNNRFRKVATEDGDVYVFVSFRRKLTNAKRFLQKTIISAILELLVLFFPVCFFSKHVTKPIRESNEKQKLFITNAGHEIKTPLTIIDANADVIALMSGENEWITSIHNQVERLSRMTEQLVDLSKLQESELLFQKEKIVLSELLQEVIEQFEGIAITRNRKIISKINPHLCVNADQGMMEKLISILLDNAMKYADENSDIHVELKKQGRYIELKIENQTAGVKKGKHAEFFERFYRDSNASAIESDGHGIGLSIAKSIVEQHKGKIFAVSERENHVKLTVVLLSNNK
ncbi:MAG: HAMP domain-containing sensor histidine kinase [Eubacteriales bacterium]|nr:HAMP domain-containing sensor histidine kinase [Eubacteriales bacterium]